LSLASAGRQFGRSEAIQNRAVHSLFHCFHRLRQFLVQSALLLVAQFLWFENDGQFRESAGKRKWHFYLVLFQNRGSRILSHVEGFIERKANSYRLWDMALRDLLFVHQQRSGRGLADTAATVLEFNANDMIARRKGLI
jgi:hypothetical protein